MNDTNTPFQETRGNSRTIGLPAIFHVRDDYDNYGVKSLHHPPVFKMSTLFRVSACLPVWVTNSLSCTRSARASHARTLINVNPFSCLCVPACLRHASGTYLPFALNHMRLCRIDFDMFESVVVCKKKQIDVFSSYCIRQFLTFQFLLKITYMMFVSITVNYLINNTSYINSIFINDS